MKKANPIKGKKRLMVKPEAGEGVGLPGADSTEKGPASSNPEKPDSAGPAEKRFLIVGIGASAGGLEAFRTLLANLPADTGMAFVIVQHLDPDHESALPAILGRASRMPVTEATDGLLVQPDQVYVMPANVDLSISQGALRLVPRDRPQGPLHSIDDFLKSLAHDQQEYAAGVILSGTGGDGTAGLEAIKSEGGITFAQDASAKYDSMPRSAIAAGCVDFALAPEAIAAELSRIAKHPWAVSGAEPLPADMRDQPPGERRRPQTVAPAHSRDLDAILVLLRDFSGVDFSLYKEATLQRRILRRMALQRAETMESYASCLREDRTELATLYSDVLISVTSFFRNPEAFNILEREVFPKLVENRRQDQAVRMWVIATSTGQEAYSLAMRYLEFCDSFLNAPKLQIFASDLNEALLTKARQGFYTKAQVQDVSPERLHRFFIEEEGGYRVAKNLRELCIFSRHNLLSDPPFSRMDLISCRNLLIYLEPDLQNKILPVLHYALKPQGFLFLGASESVGPFNELFQPLNKAFRIFSRKAGNGAPLKRLPGQHVPASHKSDVGANRAVEALTSSTFNVEREAERVSNRRFAPPGVLVNSDLQILQFRGSTGPYLEPAAGKASFDLLRMARGNLRLPLRDAINKAMQQGKSVRVVDARLGTDSNGRKIAIEVIPIKNLEEQFYLVFFEETPAKEALPAEKPANLGKTAESTGDASARVAELESDIAETRDYLHSVQGQYEAAIEELQASNQEITSSNEELQSLNEELETSKEELESTNEELTTVNDEMASRNHELHQLNDALKQSHQEIAKARDFTNAVFEAVPPLMILEPDLRVRTANQSFYRTFAVNLQQTEGRLIYELGNGQWNLPELRHLLEEILPRSKSFQQYEVTCVFENLGKRTFLLSGCQIDSAQAIVLSIDDITGRKEAENMARQAKESVDKYATELERQVADRTASLTEAVAELQHFSYTLTHDLRAPLRAMAGYTELIEPERTALSETGRMYIGRIREAALRMDKLITDALNYAKLSEHALEIATVDVNALLRGMLQSYLHYQAPAAKISVAENLPAVLANEAVLTQCFSNLLDNAIKFVQPGKMPEIQIGFDVKSSNTPPGMDLVRFWVQDNGIGIPLEYHEKVFQMFQQLDPQYEGTGIGLALVRKAAQRMNGRVGVQSEPGKGSCFWLEFQKAG